LEIPVTESVSGKLGYAGGDISVNGNSWGGTNGSNAFNLEYWPLALAAMQPHLLSIPITESVSAETFDMRFIGGMYYPTQATTIVTIDFDHLRLFDVFGHEVTSQVTFSVTQESAIPEPATACLTALALTICVSYPRRSKRRR
jgi:hypothetical protein